jgi:gliding motility-associated-like protein
MFASKTLPAIVIACLIFGASNTLFAQNLVPNPSFEDMKHLPGTFWYVSNAMQREFDTTVANWYSGNLRAVLPCHTSSTINGQAGYPNPLPVQSPRTGNAVALFVTMYNGNDLTFNNERSYPTVRLKNTINVGQKVYGEFWLSYYDAPMVNFANGNNAMYFSADSIFENSESLLNVSPQILDTSIISDGINWVKVSGAFIANTPLNYLSIGLFSNGNSTPYKIYPLTLNMNSGSALYFLDDVKVRILNPQTPDTVRICKGDIAELIATGEENHQWAFAHSPTQIVGTDSIFSFTPDSSQTVLFYGSFDTLTTYVLVDELDFDLGADTVICSGTDFRLQGPPNADSYVWSTGSTAPTLPITQSGLYWLTATKGACTTHDSIFVDVVNVATLTINAPNVACLGDEMTLWVNSQPYASYLWSTGETDTAITIKEDGTYNITLTHPCGTASASYTAVFEKCVCHFFLPNAFSPNGDGVNDEFFPVFDCSIRNYFITITDRWGNVRFQSTNPDERWNGQDAQPGVYNVHVFYQGLNEEGQTVGDDFVQVLTVID